MSKLPDTKDDEPEEQDDERSWREAFHSALLTIIGWLGQVGAPAKQAPWKEYAVTIREALTSRRAVSLYVLVVLAATAVGTVLLSLNMAGTISTVVYVIAFVFGVTFIPFTILLGAPSFPGFMRKLFGKLHWVLGQVAFGVGYLVQRGTRWEMCPGTREAVFIDGEWRDIEGGQENLQILGWKPFGIIFDKDADQMEEESYDGDRIASADGGEITRQGHHQAQPNQEALDDDSTRVIDLKHVFESGVREIGSVRIIEKAEEIIKREETADSSMGGWETIVATAVGVMLGVGTGYLAMGGF